MNKKTVSKVNLFFGGLVSRMEENKDFFNDITINLKSGTKNFPAKILYTDDITLDYQAVKRNVEKDGLWDIIAEELLKYDEAQIIYSERGAKIVIDANDKKLFGMLSKRQKEIIDVKKSICVTRMLRKR